VQVLDPRSVSNRAIAWFTQQVRASGRALDRLL